MARSKAKYSKPPGRTALEPPRGGVGSHILGPSLGQQGYPSAGSGHYIPQVTPHPLPQSSWLEEPVEGMAPLEDYLSKSLTPLSTSFRINRFLPALPAPPFMSDPRVLPMASLHSTRRNGDSCSESSVASERYWLQLTFRKL